MLSLRHIGQAFLICLFLVSVLLVLFHLSLWFIWHLLPPDSGQVKIAYNRHINERLPPAASNYLSGLFPPDYAIFLSHVRRLSLSYSSNSSTLILVPNNPFSISERRALSLKLQQAGWQTKNYGLLLISTKNGGFPAFQALAKASNRAAVQIFLSPRFNQPIIIGSNLPLPIPLTQETLPQTSLIISHNPAAIDEVLLYFAPGLNSILSASAPPPAVSSVAGSDFSFTASPEAYLRLPAFIIGRLNQYVAGKLSFNFTHPLFIQDLKLASSVQLVQYQDNVIITATGDPDKIYNQMKAWLENEESFTRPQRKKFKLPDGTSAIEYLPGDRRDILSQTPDPRCKKASWADTNLLLCVENNAVILSSAHAGQYMWYTPSSPNKLWDINHLGMLPEPIQSTYQAYTASEINNIVFMKVKLK